MKYRIEIAGRGGEITVGKVNRKFYDVFEENELDLEDYCWNSDFFEENEEVVIPEDIRPFSPGDWYDCDDIAHNCGADVEYAYVTIYDSLENIIVDSTEIVNFTDQGALVNEVEEIRAEDHLNDGDVYFVGQSFEKGVFSSYEFEDNEFDPKKLTFMTTDVEGWVLVTGVQYNGVDLADLGELSTDGKSSEVEMILVEKDYV